MTQPTGLNLKKLNLHDKGLPGGNNRTAMLKRKGAANIVSPEKAERSSLQPPRWLKTKSEIVNFIYMRDLALSTGAIGTTDMAALGILCQSYAQYHSLSDQIAEEGLTVIEIGAKGTPITRANPLISERNRAYAAMHQLMKEFGLTPNSRRYLNSIEEAQEVDPEEESWDAVLQ